MGKINIKTTDGTVKRLTFMDADSQTPIEGVVGFDLSVQDGNIIATLKITTGELDLSGLEAGVQLVKEASVAKV